MQILSQNFGAFKTNCYITKHKDGEIIIDPGDGAAQWVLKNVTNPLAILCTHGHFDHTFDAYKLKNELKVPVYIHFNDNFMLKEDIFECDITPFSADILVGKNGDESVKIGSEVAKFHHFAGHTPGCCMIEISGAIFSGDFLFKGSVGRWDFIYSDKNEMLKSLEKVKNLKGDFVIYPGHGEISTLSAELANLDRWIEFIKR